MSEGALMGEAFSDPSRAAVGDGGGARGRGQGPNHLPRSQEETGSVGNKTLEPVPFDWLRRSQSA
jgi:hypothetical protein